MKCKRQIFILCILQSSNLTEKLKFYFHKGYFSLFSWMKPWTFNFRTHTMIILSWNKLPCGPWFIDLVGKCGQWILIVFVLSTIFNLYSKTLGRLDFKSILFVWPRRWTRRSIQKILSVCHKKFLSVCCWGRLLFIEWFSHCVVGAEHLTKAVSFNQPMIGGNWGVWPIRELQECVTN